MRKHLALAVLLLGASALGSDNYVGTITSAGTTKNNSDTDVPFVLPAPGRFAVQCDAAAYVRGGTGSSTTVTSANGMKTIADGVYDIITPASTFYIAVISVAGTVNCKVFTVSP